MSISCFALHRHAKVEATFMQKLTSALRLKDQANSRATVSRKENKKLRRTVTRQKARIDKFKEQQAAKDHQVQQWALEAQKALLEKEELQEVLASLQAELTDMQVGVMKVLAPRKGGRCGYELVEFGMRLMARAMTPAQARGAMRDMVLTEKPDAEEGVDYDLSSEDSLKKWRRSLY